MAVRTIVLPHSALVVAGDTVTVGPETAVVPAIRNPQLTSVLTSPAATSATNKVHLPFGFSPLKALSMAPGIFVVDTVLGSVFRPSGAQALVSGPGSAVLLLPKRVNR